MRCTAIRRNQPVAANNINAKDVLVLVNRVFAAAYVALACFVIRALVQHDTSLIGSMTLILLVFILAVGHFTHKAWALKASAAIFVVASLLAIPYLFSTYERELVPDLYVRITQFFFIVMLAILMVANYLIYMKLEKKDHSVR